MTLDIGQYSPTLDLGNYNALTPSSFQNVWLPDGASYIVAPYFEISRTPGVLNKVEIDNFRLDPSSSSMIFQTGGHLPGSLPYLSILYQLNTFRVSLSNGAGGSLSQIASQSEIQSAFGLGQISSRKLELHWQLVGSSWQFSIYNNGVFVAAQSVSLASMPASFAGELKIGAFQSNGSTGLFLPSGSNIGNFRYYQDDTLIRDYRIPSSGGVVTDLAQGQNGALVGSQAYAPLLETSHVSIPSSYTQPVLQGSVINPSSYTSGASYSRPNVTANVIRPFSYRSRSTTTQPQLETVGIKPYNYSSGASYTRPFIATEGLLTPFNYQSPSRYTQPVVNAAVLRPYNYSSRTSYTETGFTSNNIRPYSYNSGARYSSVLVGRFLYTSEKIIVIRG